MRKAFIVSALLGILFVAWAAAVMAALTPLNDLIRASFTTDGSGNVVKRIQSVAS